MEQIGRRISYMDYWHFDKETKEAFIRRLSVEHSTLRGAVGASQDEIANVIGVSRQTYNLIELQKRLMSWSLYMALILFFDYNPSSHDTIRQLDAFPCQLGECRLSEKVGQIGESK